MTKQSNFADRHPVWAYVLLCFGITWPVWFAIPLVAGPEWTLTKVLLGMGFGPALAAIVLDRMRGTGARLASARWWGFFTAAFVVVLAINASMLLWGDAMAASELGSAEPLGLEAIGIVGSLLAAAMAGFIFASVASSRSPRLNSLVAWRMPALWWLVALFLVASFYLLGWAITRAAGGPVESVEPGLEPGAWAFFLLRSVVATFVIVAVGEETGWRGWMLPELQKRFSPLTSSALLGVAWGLWHLPLFVIDFYPDDPVMVFAKAGACVILAVLFTWLYNRTGGSLLLAAVLHTAFNNTPRVLPASPGMGVLLLGFVVAVIVTDRMWRLRSAPSSVEPARS